MLAGEPLVKVGDDVDAEVAYRDLLRGWREGLALTKIALEFCHRITDRFQGDSGTIHFDSAYSAKFSFGYYQMLIK